MKKILIFYASYGGGHLSAAKSIQECILKNYKDVDTELIDCMKRGPRFKRRNWRTGEYEGVDSLSLKDLLNQPDFIHAVEDATTQSLSFQEQLASKIK